jgi:hypothetical protein
MKNYDPNRLKDRAFLVALAITIAAETWLAIADHSWLNAAIAIGLTIGAISILLTPRSRPTPPPPPDQQRPRETTAPPTRTRPSTKD